LATVCFFATVPAVGVGGGAEALAASGLPTVLTGTNTFDNRGGTIVRGYVTPNGSPVSECRFEYGLTEGYGESAACEGEVGAGSKPVEVTLDVRGLKAGATYHFRIVATNGWGTSESEDSVFVAPAEEQQESCSNAGMPGVGFLPGCRGWEMVSSNAKAGADVALFSEGVRAANDGSAASFYSLGGFGDVLGSSVGFEYMGVRSETPAPGNQGWVTHSIMPPQPSMSFEEIVNSSSTKYVDFEGFSPDLNKAVTIGTRPITNDPMVKNLIGSLYLREDLRTPGVGDYRLVTACPVCASPLPTDTLPVTLFAGATADYSRVVFESRDNLTEGTNSNGRKVYEWHDGVVTLVSKAPDGSTLPDAAAGNLEDFKYKTNPPPHHVISDDGSKIFFQNRVAGHPENLYMRENGTTTVQLNASERTVPTKPEPAFYGIASKDGSRVFFTSKELLTNDAPTVGNKLYMYNTMLPPEDPHNLTLLTPGTGNGSVERVIGASDDGSYVYFEVSHGSEFVKGAPAPRGNEMYVWHEGVVSFVGEINEVGFFQPQPIVSGGGSLIYWSRSPGGAPVAFGFKELCAPPGCGEVFSYRPTTHQLTCVSCSQSASTVGGEAIYEVAKFVSGTQVTGHHGRPVTSDGKYVFFSSPTALVPGDTNGVYDAYVYDTETGRVSLLSSGESAADSYFVEATPSGHDAFFVTRDQLVGWDSDHNYDLYDARVGGGFPEPPLPPPACEGDACQPPALSLNDPTPASSTFAGGGNLQPAVVKPAKRKAHKKPKKTARHHRRPAARKARRGR
jgi:hypothetical protein